MLFRSPTGGGVCGADDCDDDDPALWGLPGEIGAVQFQDATFLAWQPPADPGGLSSGLHYSTIRSSNPADFESGVVCIESRDGSDSLAEDSSTTESGGIHFYLVRAGNGCGTGPVGAGSDGVPRVAAECR